MALPIKANSKWKKLVCAGYWERRKGRGLLLLPHYRVARVSQYDKSDCAYNKRVVHPSCRSRFDGRLWAFFSCSCFGGSSRGCLGLQQRESLFCVRLCLGVVALFLVLARELQQPLCFEDGLAAGVGVGVGVAAGVGVGVPAEGAAVAVALGVGVPKEVNVPELPPVPPEPELLELELEELLTVLPSALTAIVEKWGIFSHTTFVVELRKHLWVVSLELNVSWQVMLASMLALPTALVLKCVT